MKIHLRSSFTLVSTNMMNKINLLFYYN